MFTNAIVRTPGRSIVEGLSDSKTLGLPNYEQAIIQHQSYIDVLTKCGLDVLVLEPCEEYPDSTFVEDVALITPNCVIITRPGAPSRRGEVHEIEFLLKQKFNNIEAIEAPGTIEGGDIMMIGDHYYIGLSKRTNLEGAKQIIQILSKYGMSGSTISLNKVLHLKTGLSYLEENNLIGNESYISNKTSYNFDETNSINFSTRKNKKTDLTEFYNLIYQYQNDCLVAAIEYNKNYYEDSDLKPSENIFFSLTLKPFGTTNSPSVK